MNHPYQPSLFLSAPRLPRIVVVVLFVALTSCNSALAQFIFTGPHEVEPGPIVTLGSSTDPIEIALESWIKTVGDPTDVIPGAATLDMVESIQNVGTVAWGSWQEEFLLPPGGLDPSLWFWESVVSVSVNGSPHGFTTTGLGTFNLTLDFTEPVLPGDLLMIHKQIRVDGSIDTDGGPLLRMLEYPTQAVPEPGSLVLATLGSLAFLGIRRLR